MRQSAVQRRCASLVFVVLLANIRASCQQLTTEFDPGCLSLSSYVPEGPFQSLAKLFRYDRSSSRTPR